MVTCEACKRPCDDDAHFCPRCGRPLSPTTKPQDPFPDWLNRLMAACFGALMVALTVLMLVLFARGVWSSLTGEE